MNTAPRRGLGRGLGELLNRSEPDGRADDADADASDPRGTGGQHHDPAGPPTPSAAAGDPAQSPGDDDAGTHVDVATADNDAEDRGQPSDTSEPRTKIPNRSYFADIPVGRIRANPRQPRGVFDEDAQRELVDSIAEIGVLQPVVIRPLDASETSRNGEVAYELVMGERRWRAVQTAGLDTIPAIVRPTEEHAMLRDALLENLHRTQLNPLEEASAYQQLLDDFDCTQDELAGRIKRSRPQISNTLRLLRLPPAVQRRVAAGVLSAGHARALLVVEDLAAQERIAQRVVAEGLSVRATEELAALGEEPAKQKRSATAPRETSARADELAEQLSERLETRVKISMGRSRGRISIEFATEDDLERIAGLMENTPRFNDLST